MTGVVTLWWLGEEVEEAFDAQWEAWLDAAADWKPDFAALAASKSADIAAQLMGPPLVAPADKARMEGLKIDAGGRAVYVADAFDGGREDVAMLAIGFARGKVGELVVPYARRAA